MKKRAIVFILSFLSGVVAADSSSTASEPVVPQKSIERRASQRGPAPEVPRRNTVSSPESSSNKNPVGTGRPLPPPPVPAKGVRRMTTPKGEAPAVPARARSSSEQELPRSSKDLKPETSRRRAGTFAAVDEDFLEPVEVHVDTHERTKADEEYEKFLDDYTHDSEPL